MSEPTETDRRVAQIENQLADLDEVDVRPWTRKEARDAHYLRDELRELNRTKGWTS